MTHIDNAGRPLAKGDRLRIEIPQWLMRANDLASREFEVEVEAISAKALLVKGRALIEASQTCRRCGREITHPGSRLLGYGIDCVQMVLGVSRPEVESLTEDDLAEVERIRAAHRTEAEISTWVPVSKLLRVETIEAAEVPAEASKTKRVRATAPFQIRIEDGRIRVAGEFRYKETLKSIEGRRWDGATKEWHYPASAMIAREVVAKLRAATGREDLSDSIEWSTPEDRAQFADLYQGARAIEEAQGIKSATNLADADSVQTSLWDHQRQAFHFARQVPAALLNMHMGTGKTLVSIAAIAEEEAARTIVLAPKRVLPVWPKEFAKHAADPDSWIVVAPSTGSTERRAKEIREAAQEAQRTGRRLVVAVNYEATLSKVLGATLIDLAPEFVVFDEIHRIKAPGGKASRYAERLSRLPSVRKRLGLTGTFLPHSPMDAYAQLRALDPGVFGTSFARFRDRYAVRDHFGGIRGFQNLDEFEGKLSPIVYRAAKDVLQNLPSLRHEEIEIEIGAEARRLYDSLEGELFAAWEEGTISVTNTLTKLLRLQQITSGFAQTDDDEAGRVRRVDTAKATALSDLLEDLPQSEPVVVFSIYREDLQIVREIAEKLGRRYAELSGDRDDLEEWQAGSAEILGVNIRAGGLGVDLTRARIAVYYSQTFSLGDYEQSLDRLHRPGQSRGVIYYHLIATGTVNERVYKALRDKKRVVESVMPPSHAQAAQERPATT